MEKLKKGDKVICTKPFYEVDDSSGEETEKEYVSPNEKGIVKSDPLDSGGVYLQFKGKTVWHNEVLNFLARIKIIK